MQLRVNEHFVISSCLSPLDNSSPKRRKLLTLESQSSKNRNIALLTKYFIHKTNCCLLFDLDGTQMRYSDDALQLMSHEILNNSTRIYRLCPCLGLLWIYRLGAKMNFWQLFSPTLQCCCHWLFLRHINLLGACTKNVKSWNL